MKKKKMLFFYLRTGGGHISNARTVADEISRSMPGRYDIKLVDALEGGEHLGKLILEDGYQFTQNKAKWLYEFGYALTKIPAFARGTVDMTKIMVREYVKHVLEEEKPDKIVIFHGFIITGIEEAVRDLKLKIPVLTVVTDPFTSPNTWYAGKMTKYVVFSRRAFSCATKMGIAASRIKLIPNYIANPKYSTRLGKGEVSALKKRLGFSEGKKVVLLLSGGEGLPNGKEILRQVLMMRADDEVAVVCGKSEDFRKQAEALRKKYPGRNVKVYGFVDFVYELINCADAVITKSGPSTLWEILLQGKIPLIISYTWEQEKGNMEFVVKNRVGLYEPEPKNVPDMINRALRDRRFASEFSRRLKKLKVGNGVRETARYVVK